MGGGSTRSATGAGDGIGASPGRRDLCGQHAQCSGDKGATATIPIVFVSAGDPVQLGLVASFNRPGGNATGINLFTTELESKKLELLHEFVPKAAVIGALVNPSYVHADTQSNDLQSAARVLGRQIHVVNASNESDIDAAYA